MKNKLTKIISLLLVFSFVFAFSACKKDETETTAATTAQADTTAGETTAETTLPGDTTAEVTTALGETTTIPAGIVAPVGSDIAKIVAFYNQYANATKEYKGKINVQLNMKTETTITKMAVFKDQLQKLLDEKLKKDPQNKTFVNGKNIENSNDTLEKFLPRGGGEKMSILTTPGVKSASCVTDGTGWKVVILLKREVAAINEVPKYHASVMDPLEIDSDSLKPFTLGEGKVIYGKTDPASDGATLTAKINSKGYLDTLYMDAPLVISGKLGMFNQGIDTIIEGKFIGDMTFTYYS